jgi:Scd6-like Sm domain
VAAHKTTSTSEGPLNPKDPLYLGSLLLPTHLAPSHIAAKCQNSLGSFTTKSYNSSGAVVSYRNHLLTLTPFNSSRISLISKSDIRYVGILHAINSDDATVALEHVQSCGTEGRRGGEDEIPPSTEVYEYILFKGSDVKDLRIEEPAEKPKQPPPAMPDDPAILGVGATISVCRKRRGRQANCYDETFRM